MKNAIFACLFSALVIFPQVQAASLPRYVPKHRPYSGIGVLILNKHSIVKELNLYEEPGISRITSHKYPLEPPFSHVFGNNSSANFFIVTARHQKWVKIVYDEAGREGWLNLNRSDSFKSYGDWLRQEVVSILPGLQKQFYGVSHLRGGQPFMTITPKSKLKIIAVNDSWAEILTDMNQIGWIRWKDDDGRLLISFLPQIQGVKP